MLTLQVRTDCDIKLIDPALGVPEIALGVVEAFMTETGIDRPCSNTTPNPDSFHEYVIYILWQMINAELTSGKINFDEEEASAKFVYQTYDCAVTDFMKCYAVAGCDSQHMLKMRRHIIDLNGKSHSFDIRIHLVDIINLDR